MIPFLRKKTKNGKGKQDNIKEFGDLIRAYSQAFIFVAVLFLLSIVLWGYHQYSLEEKQALERLRLQASTEFEAIRRYFSSGERIVSQMQHDAGIIAEGNDHTLRIGGKPDELKTTLIGDDLYYNMILLLQEKGLLSNTLLQRLEYDAILDRVEKARTSVFSDERVAVRMLWNEHILFDASYMIGCYFISGRAGSVYPSDAISFLEKERYREPALSVGSRIVPSIADRLQWTTPYEGGEGFGVVMSCRSPVFEQDTFLGYVGVTVSLDKIIQEHGISLTRGGNFMLLTKNNQVVSIENNQVTLNNLYMSSFFNRNKKVVEALSSLAFNNSAIIELIGDDYVVFLKPRDSEVAGIYSFPKAQLRTLVLPRLPMYVISTVGIVFVFGLLFYLINRLLGHAYEQAKRAYAESTQKEGELTLLKSQINPHFLFNSLNTVRALIGEDPKKASSAITLLSRLLRSSLKMGETELIPFDQEWDTVKSFLEMEKMRFEERLHYEFKNENVSMNFLFPPMLLQTLVENALKHGIERLPEGGTVTVRLREFDEEKALLTVSNPGSLDDKPKETMPNSRSTRIGLKNAEERLKIIWGNAANLKLEQEGAYVTVKVIFPFRRELNK